MHVQSHALFSYTFEELPLMKVPPRLHRVLQEIKFETFSEAVEVQINVSVLAQVGVFTTTWGAFNKWWKFALMHQHEPKLSLL